MSKFAVFFADDAAVGVMRAETIDATAPEALAERLNSYMGAN
jgi:hypothetical protein